MNGKTFRNTLRVALHLSNGKDVFYIYKNDSTLRQSFAWVLHHLQPVSGEIYKAQPHEIKLKNDAVAHWIKDGSPDYFAKLKSQRDYKIIYDLD